MSFLVVLAPVSKENIAAAACNPATNRRADSGAPADTGNEGYFSFHRFIVFHIGCLSCLSTGVKPSFQRMDRLAHR